MIDWLLKHRPVLVILCVATIIGVSALIDLLLRRLGFPFQIRLPHRILALVSTILVALVYCTFFAITAVVMKLLGRRLLPRPSKEGTPTYWTEHQKIEPTLESLKHQG